MIELVTDELTNAAALLHQPNGHLLPTTQPGRRSHVRRVPHGIVGVISPWNFPGVLSMRSVAPALALGNFSHPGRTCMAVGRHLMHEPLAER